jgi:hypothetical protein
MVMLAVELLESGLGVGAGTGAITGGEFAGTLLSKALGSTALYSTALYSTALEPSAVDCSVACSSALGLAEASARMQARANSFMAAMIVDHALSGNGGAWASSLIMVTLTQFAHRGLWVDDPEPSQQLLPLQMTLAVGANKGFETVLAGFL